MKTHKPIDHKQPAWVCRDCGGTWGLWWDKGTYLGPPRHCATFHKGICGVCNKEAGVTEPRDYGYLAEGWHKALID